LQANPLGHVECRGELRLHQPDQKFIAPVSTDDIRRPHGRLERLRHPAKQRVARRVPEGVVDALEVVYIDEQEGHGAAKAPGPLDFPRECIECRGAIQDLSQ
jgi:hypothetical protein